MTPYARGAYSKGMISTFWFLIKTGLFVALCAWLFSLGGTVAIDAYGYNVVMSLGVAIIVSAVVIYTISLFVRAIRAILYTPHTISTMIEKRSQKTGMRSLAYGLSAVAAGDVKTASYYSKKATKLLQDDYGLVALLAGLSARLKGDERAAEKSFKSLLKHDETSFLGVRGLLQTALDRGDYRYARVLARQAYEANPRQEWTLRTLYDLELRHKNFDAALDVLKQGAKINAFDQAKMARDRAAIDFVQGHVASAHKAAPSFMPATLKHAMDLASADKRRGCLNAIKDAWAVNPHPELMSLWLAEAPKKTQSNPQRMMAWVEDLWAINKRDASCNLYVADVAMRYHFDAQAKRFLEMALEQKPTMRTYQYLASLQPQSGWQDHIAKGAADKTWICRETGKMYDQWQPFNDAGQFNTIDWMYPDDRRAVSQAPKQTSSFFLDDVKKAA